MSVGSITVQAREEADPKQRLSSPQQGTVGRQVE